MHTHILKGVSHGGRGLWVWLRGVQAGETQAKFESHERHERRLGWGEWNKIYIQRRRNLGGHGVPMLRGLGRGEGSYWWGSPGKMHVGAGLWSCGDALSTAEIWSSDSRLVFLLHNQFAVWIPLHITLNMHSSPDPAKSLFSFTLCQFHVVPFFTCSHLCLSHLQTWSCPISKPLNYTRTWSCPEFTY